MPVFTNDNGLVNEIPCGGCGWPLPSCPCDSEAEDSEPTVRPFSNGGEYAAWTHRHCNQCAKGVHRLAPEAWPTCELEAALLMAYGTDGHIPLEIANRIGLDENENRLCSEMQPT